ncbi:MAG: hypothetical protein P4L33_12915 [Capsulimonadaceae bacterium]|nr:hypothetical protein [Capsulimonadaceae bacterium]
MANHYKLTITFTGVASVSVEADSMEEAREKAAQLKIEDLARQGYADVSELKVSARAVRRQGSLLVNEDEDDSQKAGKRRPSGWYRPF